MFHIRENRLNVYLPSLTLALVFVSILNCSNADVPEDEDFYPLINKCCGLSQYYDSTTNKCEDLESESNSSLWSVLSNFSDTGLPFNVKFKPASPPACSTPLRTITISSDEHVDENPQYFLDPEGTLKETNYDSDDYLLHQLHHLPHHYCIDVLEDAVVFRVCPARCDDKEPCYRQCCPHGHYLDPHNYTCVPLDPTITSYDPFPIFNHPHHPANNTNMEEPRVTIGHDFINLSSGSGICLTVSTGWESSVFKTPFKILSNGSIVIFFKENNSWTTVYKPEDYCVDSFYSETEEMLCKGERHVLYYCTNISNGTKGNDIDETFFELLGTFAKISLAFAIICLFLTAIVVFTLIDRGNLQSWTRLSFVTSEFIFLLLFSFAYSDRFQDPELYPASCEAYAIMFHYTGLMTLCWLSVMNFDLWWTFKVLQPSSSNKLDVRRFLCYAAFALGVPLLIIVIALGIQSSKPRFESTVSGHPGLVCHKDVPELMKVGLEALSSKLTYPDYAQTHCGLSKESLGAYWYGPLCVLLFSNLVFFVATTSRMANLRRMTRRASLDSTGGQRNQSNKIFMKIFIASGLTWNLELIGWLVDIDSKYRLDIVHHLQAMALFYIFVCKKAVLRGLQRKSPIIAKITSPGDSTQRSGGLGVSSTTDLNFRARFGRKMSSSSTNSSVAGVTISRQESFDLPSLAVMMPLNQQTLENNESTK